MHKIALGKLFLKIYILLRSDYYFGRTEINLVSQLSCSVFRRLIPHTAETSFENQKTFFTKQQVTNQIRQTIIHILSGYFLSLYVKSSFESAVQSRTLPHWSTAHRCPFQNSACCVTPSQGRLYGHSPVQFGDHLRSGIICGPGSFAILGSFADPYKTTSPQRPVFNHTKSQITASCKRPPLITLHTAAEPTVRPTVKILVS